MSGTVTVQCLLTRPSIIFPPALLSSYLLCSVFLTAGIFAPWTALYSCYVSEHYSLLWVRRCAFWTCVQRPEEDSATILGAILLMAAVAATLVQGVMCLLAALQLALPLPRRLDVQAPAQPDAPGSSRPESSHSSSSGAPVEDSFTVTVAVHAAAAAGNMASAAVAAAVSPVAQPETPGLQHRDRDAPRGPATGRLRPVVHLERTPALLRAWLLLSGGWARWERLFFPLARLTARKRLGRGHQPASSAAAAGADLNPSGHLQVVASTSSRSADGEDDLVRSPGADDVDPAQLRRIASVSVWAVSLAMLGCIIGGSSFNRLHKAQGGAPGNASGAGLTATAVGLQVIVCALALWIWREETVPRDWRRIKAAAAWALSEGKALLAWLRAFACFVAAEGREAVVVAAVRILSQYAGWQEKRRLAREAANAARAAAAAAQAAAAAAKSSTSGSGMADSSIMIPDTSIAPGLAEADLLPPAQTQHPLRRRIALVRSASAASASASGSGAGSALYAAACGSATQDLPGMRLGASIGLGAGDSSAPGGGAVVSAEPEQTHFYDEVPLPSEAVAGLLPEALTENFILFLRTPVSPNPDPGPVLEATPPTRSFRPVPVGSQTAHSEEADVASAAGSVTQAVTAIGAVTGRAGSMMIGSVTPSQAPSQPPSQPEGERIIVGYPKQHKALSDAVHMRIGSAAIAAGSAAIVVLGGTPTSSTAVADAAGTCTAVDCGSDAKPAAAQPRAHAFSSSLANATAATELPALPAAAAAYDSEAKSTAAAAPASHGEASSALRLLAVAPTPTWLMTVGATQAGISGSTARAVQVFDERQLVIIRMSADGTAADVVSPSLTTGADPDRLVAVSAAHTGVRLPRTVSVWSSTPAATGTVPPSQLTGQPEPDSEAAPAAARAVSVPSPTSDARLDSESESINIGAKGRQLPAPHHDAKSRSTPPILSMAADGENSEGSAPAPELLPAAAAAIAAVTSSASGVHMMTPDHHDASECHHEPQGMSQAEIAAVNQESDSETELEPPRSHPANGASVMSVAASQATMPVAPKTDAECPPASSESNAAAASVDGLRLAFDAAAAGVDATTVTVATPAAASMQPASTSQPERRARAQAAPASAPSSRPSDREKLHLARYNEVPVPPSDLKGILPPEMLAAYDIWARTPAQPEDTDAGESDAAYAARCALAPPIMVMVGYPSGERPAALGLSPAATALLAAAPASGGVNSLHFTEAQLLRIARDSEGNLTVHVPLADTLPQAATTGARSHPVEVAASGLEASTDPRHASAGGEASLADTAVAQPRGPCSADSLRETPDSQHPLAAAAAPAPVNHDRSLRRPLVHAASQAHLRTLLAVDELERRLRSTRV